MDVWIKFSLPEEAIEHEECINGSKFKRALYDLEQYLRKKIKYEDKRELEETRKMFYEILSNYNIDLNN